MPLLAPFGVVSFFVALFLACCLFYYGCAIAGADFALQCRLLD